jgi:CheY-like chemotaxis protein
MTDDATTPHDALDSALHDTEAAVGQALEGVFNSRAGLEQIKQRIRNTPPPDHDVTTAGLPLHKNPPAATEVAPSQTSDRRPRSQPHALQTKAKILIVDDRPENLLALEAILSALDQTLVRASSGEEALKALLTDDFAVILLDVQMPGMDGFETAAHIKRRQRTRDIPIIFLTAINHGPHHTFRGYAAGAVDYISKPFDPWALRAKVSVFIELYMKNVQLKEQAALLRLELEGEPGMRPTGLLAELSARLAAVEEEVEGITKDLDEMSAGVARSVTADRLELRIRRLRQALDALDHPDSRDVKAPLD